MKYILILLVAILSTGCTSILNKTMRITQEFEGSGSISVTTRLGTGTAVVDNARQEDGDFKADKLDIVVNDSVTGTKIEIHGEPYSRPLVEKSEEE
jgi:hypothetical protein